MFTNTTNNYFGYIEGYYGNLLRWNDRKKIILSLKKNGMNSYFYAPKEDQNHRFSWRKNYSKKWLINFKNFCKFGKKHNIKVIAGVSPGADFNFNEIYESKGTQSSKDLLILLDKCKTLIGNGATEISILFDDIPDVFTTSFKNYNEGKSHAKLVRILSKRLNKKLLVVPRIYADELKYQKISYLNDFVKELKNISKIFYCGKYIVNDKFESKEIIINNLFKNKKIIFWDNFYANDYCPSKIFLGPYLNDYSNKNLMFNLTGLINTDLLLIEIIKNCINKKNKFDIWKEIILNNKIPKNFIEIISFFEKPVLTNEKKVREIDFDNKIFAHLDFLLWKWKSPLSLEWYKYLLILKQDIEIFNKNLNSNRILKIRTYPMQKIFLNRSDT